MAAVDAASDTMRCSWDYILKMTAMEFCNVLSYRKDKQAREKAAELKYIDTH